MGAYVLSSGNTFNCYIFKVETAMLLAQIEEYKESTILN